MEISTGIICGVVTALTGAIIALWKQNKDEQNRSAALLAETKELMGSLVELIRNANALHVEVKDTISGCKHSSGASDD